MKKFYLFLLLVCINFSGFAQTSTFPFTGTVQIYTVPAGVTQVSIDARGGEGGGGIYNVGGAGGRVQCTLNVTPAQVYSVYVGNVGATNGNNTGTFGANGFAGHVGGNGTTGSSWPGGAGGGATEIWLGAAPVIVVGAGGGGSGDCTTDHGGLGGAAVGGNGLQCGTYSSTYCGAGGNTTTSTGGVGGSCGGAGNGTQYIGGNASTTGLNWDGGGGAGYYGGGGGCSEAAGGGGSSYPATASGNITAITHTQGFNSSGAGSVTIVALCNAPGTITGTTTICMGATSTLADATSAAAGSWTSSNTAVATIGPSTGIVTPVGTGTTTITYVISSPCGGSSATTTVTINAAPGTITGSASACVGSTTTLSDASSGGVWTSSNTGQATVGSTTGIVTGVASGTPNISYTLPSGCFISTPATISSNPGAVTGAGTICGGSVPTTITLSDGTAGGAWSSSNTGLATVGSTGIVTGVAAGSPVISYIMPAGCFATTTVTVNTVAPILGPIGVCLGGSVTLTDATAGGTWSSSNPGVATINSSGVVTSVSLGSSGITYAVPSVGCSAAQTINVSTASPSIYAVTGGGTYCSGTGGVHIGVNNSNSGVTYYLLNGPTVVTTVVSSGGGAVDFGLITGAGTYTVVANYGTTCATNMTGSATVSINPLPTAFTVGGGGAYCAGGTGTSVTLSSSTPGVNYQLMLGATPIGASVVGTALSLTFPAVTAAGTYTVTGTNASTGCVNSMAGSAVVSINALPTIFSITGGGGFCLGGSGVHIGVSNSVAGTNYQLFFGGSPVGAALSGTGAALDFGLFTSAGSYTVTASVGTTGCSASMSGTATVSINPLPTAFTVTGGGGYCSGGTGSAIGLNGSTIGVSYQLYNGLSPQGSPVIGTGVSIAFPLQTGAGSYSVVATDPITGCTNNMTGSVSVSVNPLPTVFTVTGGGGYCAGGSGVHIGVSSSTLGTTYSLFNGVTLVGAAAGTGSAVDFGLYLVAGSYTVSATNTATGCVGNMSGTVTVTINPVPLVNNVTGGGSYCAGGTGVVIGLNGSVSGVNYQLYNGATPIGAPVAGSGAAISYGLQTAAGSYTVFAINPTTACSNNMAGSAVITINPLPIVYAMTGGGGYCAGGTGRSVGLAASDAGINYQLYNGIATVGGTIAGTGAAINFGTLTAVGTYTVAATNPATTCKTGMSGSSVISINALPTAYAVTGGGAYCAGGAGMHAGLASSTVGVNYQLYNGITPVGGPVAGTSGAIDFGSQTAAGTYTVVATNATTICSNNMTGSVTITINPLPAVFTVTGGGNYCSGGLGLHVGLSGSVAGVNYQLMNGILSVGLPAPGTGSALDFGLQSAGTYTVVATNGFLCTNNMTGSVTIATNPLPGLNNVTGGGSYCAGGTGVHIGLNGSIIGVSYQLYNSGTPAGSPMVGTSLPLDFGPQTAAGTYTVTGTNIITGCQAIMTGNKTITVNALPSVFDVIGGGNYCAGGTGVDIELDGADFGVTYQLMNGLSTMGAPVTGTGLPINFGLQTAAGLYTVVATNPITGCSSNMAGSAVIAIDPLPVMYNVTGGGNYCNGGGGADVGQSGSDTGVTYQLWYSFSPVGTAVPGSGLSIDFGLQTGAGSYTVIATNNTTTCTNTMNGSATVGVNPLPALHNVTGGGDYCAGGTGVLVGLDGSNLGTVYRLYNGLSIVGSGRVGTGHAISFGLQTASGSYSVVATNTGTTCVNTMTGSVNVNIDPLPTAYPLTGGGSYCSGGTGLNISLSNSDFGISYQLYNGTTMVGLPMPGTGGAISFGQQTAAGTYTVAGTDGSSFCTNNMSNTLTITISPVPTAYAVTGGGHYCSGGTGLHVRLSGSNIGVTYQLINGLAPVGVPMPGTGLPLDFGLQTAAGTYTVVASNAPTACINSMTGSATIVADPLPVIYSMSSTSSNYCAGGSGVHIWLNNSDAGINYQLYNGSVPSGFPVAGSGAVLDFGFRFVAGSYRIVGANATTGCTDTMSSGVTIVVNPLPTAYAITGGGGYCAGSSGVHVGLSGSDTGISYQLFNGVTSTGVPVAGTGGAIDFGLQTAIGNYTVAATNVATTCVSNMSGMVTVAMNSLPAVFIVTGGGTFCAGGSGISVGLNGSVIGVSYQLYRGGTALAGSPMAGSGASLDFGAQTIGGTYTVVATAASGCTNIMAGTAIVNVNAAPVAWSVVGGGNFCATGTGVHVGISGSTTGISYQLLNGGTVTGSASPGTGGAIDFGSQTAAGTYTVLATNTTTGCTSTMSGSANIMVNPLPATYMVMGGGSYCAGGPGISIGISNSDLGINYILYVGTTAVTSVAGTGSPLGFGAQTAAGTYKVQAVSVATGCSAWMTGTVSIVINPVVVPAVSISTGAGATICDGVLATFTATTVNGGLSPLYQWTINGVATAVGNMYSYIPSNGDVVGVTLTSSATCATPALVSNTITMTVDPNESPVVTVIANPGTVLCKGTGVTFTAHPLYGGATPTYTWVKNGVNVATTNTYSYLPDNGDVISCLMTSDYHCALSNTATSSRIDMEVDTPTLPVVTITASPGNTIAPGQQVTLTATVINGGPTPTFQWLVNGVLVPGATTPTFVSSSFNNGDSATCQVLSSGGCPNMLGFNSFYIHVMGTGVQQITSSGADVKLLPNPNKGVFILKGSLGTSDEEVLLQVTDMLGQVMYNSKLIAHNGVVNEQVDLGNSLANGMYILTLHSGTENKVFHMVIEQ